MSDSTENNHDSNDMTSLELSVFLRELADEIEGASAEIRPSLKNFQKLTLRLKRTGEKISVDVKIRQGSKLSPGSEEKPEESGLSSLKKYRAAKKRLKQAFKKIGDSLAECDLPGGDLLESFFRDSEIIVSFPEHGKKYYSAYSAACEAFRTSLNMGDLAAAKAGFEKIRDIKSECHKKHK